MPWGDPEINMGLPDKYSEVKSIIATVEDHRNTQSISKKAFGNVCTFLELAGLVHSASAAMFVVKDGNGTACIMANFSAAFLTSYDTNSGSKVGSLTLSMCVHVCVCTHMRNKTV